MALTKKAVAKNYFLDFFHLPEDYPLRVAQYPDSQLKKSEAVKTRICYSALCSIISGTAFAVPTHGGSAVVCVWAARRWHVAARKLKHIQAELTTRNIALRPFLHRDWIIPATVALVAISVGFGVVTGLEGLVPIGHPGQDGSITLQHPSGAHAVQRAVEAGSHHAADPHLLSGTPLIGSNGVEHTLSPAQDSLGNVGGHSVAHEWAAGFKDQVHSLFNSSHHAIAGMTADGTYQSAAAWVTGAHSAQLMEKQMMVLLGQQSVAMMCERLDSESLIPRGTRLLNCPRLPWATDNICSRCEEPIQSGKFYHCCECRVDDGEELTLCRKCHKNEATCCDDETHELLKVQTALPGRFFLPEDGIKLMKIIAGPKSLSCDACGSKVTRRWHYDCWDCRRNGKPWTQCIKCYKSGRTCKGDETHSFYAFQRAIFASYSDDTPYQRLEDAESGQAGCSICHALVTKGPYYHCSKCENGKFDICGQCFARDEHCKDNRHTLKKHYAWKYKRPVPKAAKFKWQCSNPQCQFEERRKDDFFFSCREKECSDGQYGICAPCYFLDYLCPKKEHDMFKCRFT